jgi:hypothetical protein
VTTPCDGKCSCPEPCPECRAVPSIPPFARLAFAWPPGADTSATITEAAPSRAGAEGPATGCATLSTPARKEGER